jgi:biofilm PGA synthesis protein PgaD
VRSRPAWLRARDRVLSAAMWAIYLYLIREVFIDLYLLAEDAFDWTLLSVRPHAQPTAFRFAYTLGLYAIVVVLNGTILIGWAVYNQLRFGGVDSRKATGAVGPAELGRFYGVAADQVAEWQKARSLVMIHDADGKLVAGVPKPPTIAPVPGAPTLTPALG